MPFRSKAQMRYFFAAERRGELPKGTARRWAHETPNLKSLPERVSKKKKKGFTYEQINLGFATDTKNQEESGKQEKQQSEQERYEESLRNYRKAYIRAKLVGPLIGLLSVGFTPRKTQELGNSAGIGPLAAALLYGASGISYGMLLSEFLYPWAVRPIPRAINRAVAGLVLGGLNSFFKYLLDKHFWDYSSETVSTSEAIQEAARKAQENAPIYAVTAPLQGVLWDWMNYGSALAPVPKRPS